MATARKLMRSIARMLLSIAAIGSCAGAKPPLHDAYRLVFSDDFQSLSLSHDGYGDYRWYPGLPWNEKLPSLGLITQADSVLQLTWKRSKGLPETSISTVARDLSHARAFCQGYFEARMSWTPTIGAWPAFWMAAINGMTSSHPAGEIDIFEGVGSQPAQYSAALHIWQDFGKTQTFETGGEFALPEGNDFSAWHTYGLLWEAGRMRWYFDDQLIYSTVTPELFNSQKFFLLLGAQEGVNWTYGDLRGRQ